MRQVITCIYILSIIFAGCNKEEMLEIPIYSPGDISKGWADMRKNGIEMRAAASSVVCYRDSGQITISFSTEDKFGILSEYFVLSCFPVRKDKYILCKRTSTSCDFIANYLTIIEDQPEDYYYLNERKPNFLQITDIDLETGWIDGIVNMHFNHDSSRKPKENPANPDKVHFYGTFRVKLPE